MASPGHRRRLCACALLFALAFPGWGARGEDAPDLAEGLRLLGEGRPAEAVAPLERAVQAAGSPEARGGALAALGRALVLAGEPYAALQHLEQAADLRQAAEDHLALAEALLAVARANAGGEGVRSLDVAPYLADAVVWAGRAEGDGAVGARRQAVLGEVLLLQGLAREAAEAFEGIDLGALETPEAPRVGDLRARALYGAGRHEEAARAWAACGNVRGEAAAYAAARMGTQAVAAYGRLLAGAPGDEALLDEAVRAARYAGAEADLAGCLADLRPEGPARARVLVARALLAQAGRAPDVALSFLTEAAEWDPAWARPRFERGRVRIETAGGDDDGLDLAVEDLLAAFTAGAGEPRAGALLWDLAGRDYAVAWRSPRALARTLRIQQALAQADPGDAVAWANLGNTLRMAGRTAEALAAYDRALQADPEDPAIVSDRGLVLEALGRPDDALVAFERAGEIDPAFDAARQNAARLLWLAGEDDRAEAHLATAEESTRETGGAWMRYRFLLDRVARTRRHPAWR